jgi:hypothetical protein
MAGFVRIQRSSVILLMLLHLELPELEDMALSNLSVLFIFI